MFHLVDQIEKNIAAAAKQPEKKEAKVTADMRWRNLYLLRLFENRLKFDDREFHTDNGTDAEAMTAYVHKQRDSIIRAAAEGILIKGATDHSVYEEIITALSGDPDKKEPKDPLNTINKCLDHVIKLLKDYQYLPGTDKQEETQSSRAILGLQRERERLRLAKEQSSVLKLLSKKDQNAWLADYTAMITQQNDKRREKMIREARVQEQKDRNAKLLSQSQSGHFAAMAKLATNSAASSAEKAKSDAQDETSTFSPSYL